MSIFQSAADNWPEDEARMVFGDFGELVTLEGLPYAENELTHDCARFKKIFARESDGDELYARFMVKINELKGDYLKTK